MALFKSPILFTDLVVQEICERAKLGYDRKMKAETFGFLFGSIDKDKRMIVKKAIYYRGGTKTRTGVIFKQWSQIWHIIKRRKELANRLRLRFLGHFHSHVEIGGEVFRSLSSEDKESFHLDRNALIEVLVSVWAGDRNQIPTAIRGLAGFNQKTGYQYRIKAYKKKRHRIYQIPIKYIRPDGIVISV